MASILSDSLSMGVTGTQISENVDNFRLDGFTKSSLGFDGGISKNAINSLEELCKTKILPLNLKCLAELGTPLQTDFWAKAIMGPNISKALGTNISLLKTANNSR